MFNVKATQVSPVNHRGRVYASGAHVKEHIAAAFPDLNEADVTEAFATLLLSSCSRELILTVTIPHDTVKYDVAAYIGRRWFPPSEAAISCHGWADIFDERCLMVDPYSKAVTKPAHLAVLDALAHRLPALQGLRITVTDGTAASFAAVMRQCTGVPARNRPEGLAALPHDEDDTASDSEEATGPMFDLMDGSCDVQPHHELRAVPVRLTLQRQVPQHALPQVFTAAAPLAPVAIGGKINEECIGGIIAEKYPQLESLIIASAPTKLEFADADTKFPRLRILEVTDCDLPETAIEAISKLPALATLNLTRCRTPPTGLRHLKSLAKTLVNLNLGNLTLPAIVMESIGQLTHLRTLNLSKCEFDRPPATATAAAAAAAAAPTNPADANAAAADAADEDATAAKEEPPFSDGTVHLGKLRVLSSLNATGSKISREAFLAICTLTRLTELRINNCRKIEDGDMVHLVRLAPRLTGLDVGATSAGAELVEAVAGLTNLRSLCIMAAAKLEDGSTRIGEVVEEHKSLSKIFTTTTRDPRLSAAIKAQSPFAMM